METAGERRNALLLSLGLLACLVGARLHNQRLDDVIPTCAIPNPNARDWYVRAGRALRDSKRIARIVLPAAPKTPAKTPDTPGQGLRDDMPADPIPAGGALKEKQALLARNQAAGQPPGHGRQPGRHRGRRQLLTPFVDGAMM